MYGTLGKGNRFVSTELKISCSLAFLGSERRNVTSNWRSFDLTTPGQRSESRMFGYSLLPQAKCKQAVSRDQRASERVKERERKSRMSVLCILLRSRCKPYNSLKQKSVAFSSLNRISNTTPSVVRYFTRPYKAAVSIDCSVIWEFTGWVK